MYFSPALVSHSESRAMVTHGQPMRAGHFVVVVLIDVVVDNDLFGRVLANAVSLAEVPVIFVVRMLFLMLDEAVGTTIFRSDSMSSKTIASSLALTLMHSVLKWRHEPFLTKVMLWQGGAL